MRSADHLADERRADERMSYDRMSYDRMSYDRMSYDRMSYDRMSYDCMAEGERGSVAVLFCFLVLIAGVLVTGLVDAGTAIGAATRADTYASEAARAASIAVGPLPDGSSADTQLAATAARSYLDQAGATGTVTVLGPGVVQVSVTVTAATPLLGIAVSQTRVHTAQLQVGVTSGEGLR